jgi:uncharacterized protein
VNAIIRGLVVKIAERCNLNCSYCYMYNLADGRYASRPVFMSRDVFQALVTRIHAYCRDRPSHKVGVIFHGGEPMLFDPAEFDAWLSAATPLIGDVVSWVLQTNATLVTDEWVRLILKHGIRTSVSLDGPPEVHDAFRVDHTGRASHARTLDGFRKLRAAGLTPNVLCVINPLQSGLDTYRHFRQLDIRRMNFLLPDVSHDNKDTIYPGLGSTPVADFLIPIFDEWFRADDPSIEIRLFTEAIRVLYGAESQTDALGNRPQNYLVIDTDGSILANDALKACYDGAPESGLNVLQHSFDDLRAGTPLLYNVMSESIPLCEQCQRCPERDVCGGGSLPNRYSSTAGFMNPSVWCRDLLKFLAHVRNQLDAVGCPALPRTTDSVPVPIAEGWI